MLQDCLYNRVPYDGHMLFSDREDWVIQVFLDQVSVDVSHVVGFEDTVVFLYVVFLASADGVYLAVFVVCFFLDCIYLLDLGGRGGAGYGF